MSMILNKKIKHLVLKRIFNFFNIKRKNIKIIHKMIWFRKY